MDSYYDADYEEVGGKPQSPQLYYPIGEVSREVGEDASTIRFWSNKYHDLLDVEFCNTHRRYSKVDIEKLKLIKKCKEKKMSHNQIINTLKETNFDISVIEKHFDEMQKPLDIQVLASAICVEIENRFSALEESIVNRINLELDKRIEKESVILKDIRTELSATVDEVISEKIEEVKGNYESTNESINEIKNQLEEIKQMSFVSKEEIEKMSYKEGFGRKLYKLLFGDR